LTTLDNYPRKTMSFDPFDHPDPFDLSDFSPTAILESCERGNTSTSSSSSTLCGNSLENLEGTSIWSPTTLNSSAGSYSGNSPTLRSYENGNIWSPNFNGSSSTSFSGSGSPTEPKPPLGLGNTGSHGSSIWNSKGNSHVNNNGYGSSGLGVPRSSSSLNANNNVNNSLVASSMMGRGSSSSSPPPMNLVSQMGNLGLNDSSLDLKQTIKALTLLQEIKDSAQRPSWDSNQASDNSLTAALQQHLIQFLLKQQAPPPPPPLSPNNDNLLRSVRYHRENAGMNEPRCTWSGQLPPRTHKNPIYSPKVFLGGVPYEISISTLLRTFRAYGNVKIDWPGKEDNPPAPKGYAYLIYENERQVKTLLQNCIYHYGNGKESTWYHKITSKRLRFHSKDIQVIPWAISDSNFVLRQTTKLDPQKTIFVGALHGMINAEGLAHIMHELFGGVVYAGIDTDRNKYPIGSARVTFNNHKSYMKAVSAEFIEIRTSKFTKKVQVDPYLEDATCSVCGLQQGPYFCRSLSCFRYFCRTCFEIQHAGEAFQSHRPITRNASRQPGSNGMSSGSAPPFMPR